MRKLLLLLSIGMLYTAQAQITTTPAIFIKGATIETVKKQFGEGKYREKLDREDKDDERRLRYTRTVDSIEITANFYFEKVDQDILGYNPFNKYDLVLTEGKYTYTDLRYDIDENNWDWDIYHSVMKYQVDIGTSPKGSRSDHWVEYKREDGAFVRKTIQVKKEGYGNNAEYKHKTIVRFEYQKH